MCKWVFIDLINKNFSNGRDKTKAGTDVGKKQESDLIYLYLTSVVESVHKVVPSQAKSAFKNVVC